MLACFTVTAQTRYLKDLVDGSASGTYTSDDFLEATDGYIYFISKDIDNGTSATEDRIYRTDGTTQNTELLTTYTKINSEIFQLNSNELIFSATEQVTGTVFKRELFTYNLTDGSITRIDIVVSETSSSFPQNLTRLGDEIIFTADHFDNGAYKGRELYKIDKNKNFGLIKELNPAPMLTGSSNANNFSNAIDNNGNDILIFSAKDGSGSGGDKTWITDGTESGTYIATPNNLSSNDELGPYYQIGSKIIFNKTFSNTGAEPWVFDLSDAVPQSTLLKEIAPNAVSSNANQFTLFNNELYFSADDGNDFELWRTDGTAAGTVMVDLDPASTNGSNPTNIVELQNRLYMSANRGVAGRELIAVLPNNTVLTAANINQATNGNSDPDNFLITGTDIYFAASDDGSTGRELYRYDTDNFSFNLVEDINNGSSNPEPKIVSNEILYHISNTDSDGRELFITNLKLTPSEITAPGVVALGSWATAGWSNNGNQFLKHELIAADQGESITEIEVLSSGIAIDTDEGTSLGGLATNTTYDFYVVSYDINGGYSISPKFTKTTETTSCVSPENFMIDANDDSSVSVSWTNPATYNQISVAIIESVGTGSIYSSVVDNQTSQTLTGSANSTIITGLNPETDYYIIIESSCSNNQTSYTFKHILEFTTDVALSNQEFNQNSISIFPNPANTSITIKDTKSEVSGIEVYDITGKKVNQFKSSADGNYDVSELSNGIYLLKVYSVNGASVTKKLIKD